MQTKRDSFKEATTNMLVGYCVYVIAQFYIYPLVGVQTSFYQNLKISAYMTIISLAKYYIVRRFFNKAAKNDSRP